jgi:RNA polymerase sigma-70 factor (ECF subfamily)
VTIQAVRTEDLEAYRRELTGYCYRMLGSGFDAEDAVQETLLRAWRAAEDFEGRSSVRSWLYRIATNVCLDALRAEQRRADPMDLSGPWSADAPLPATLPESEWVSPIADDRVLPPDADPAEVAELRDTVRLAFVAALQHLPPKQRAVLILREVLRWQATEVAELLDTSVAGVNSALQRARATLDERRPAAPVDLDEEHAALLRRYVEAFERYDVDTLVTLVSDDAAFTMPPFPMWLRGPKEIGAFYLGHGIGCRGSRLLPVRANGLPAFGAYKPAEGGGWEPWAIQVIETSGGRVVGLHHYIDERLFAAFGLPPRLDVDPREGEQLA